MKLPLKAKMLDGMPIVVDADEKCVADMAFGGEQGMELARTFAVSVNSHAALVEACVLAKAFLCLHRANRSGLSDIVLDIDLDKALALAEPEQP